MKERLRGLDPGLILPLLALIFMGSLTLYSAGKDTVWANLWLKQLLWTVIGFAAMVYLAGANHSQLVRLTPLGYIAGIALLLLVLVMGKTINGAKSWLSLGGFTLQPSEFMKWLALLAAARRIGSRPMDTLLPRDFLEAGILALFPMLLVMAQPDFGVALTFTPIFLLFVLIRGLRLRWILVGLLLAAAGGTLGWKHYLKPYQKERVLTFLNPDRDPRGRGFQVNQSRIAVGAGGLTGQGFTSGSQTQLNYLPVKTTDFAFSVWAEERGFLGVLAALTLFGLLLRRILVVASESHTAMGAYYAFGVAGILGLHVLINVGMVVGAVPTTGIPLPFFSYGGSSTLAFFLALGLVLNIHRHSKTK